MLPRILLIAAAVIYLLLTIGVAGTAARLTLWAYGISGEPLSDTVSAAILNASAATLIWLAFFGGLDMFFTFWQMMQNRRQADLHQKEKETWEEQRKAQAQALEEQRKAQAQALEEQRQFQQAILQQMAAEQEANRQERAQLLATIQAESESRDLLMARFLELTEKLGNGNGNDSDGGAPAS